nr:site-specific integrase [Marispirochaeta sp.]
MTKENHDWYAKMVRTLQINGKSSRTQQAYTRAVRQLTAHCRKNPEAISEQELEDYFLFRRNESQWAPKTLNLSYCAVRFCYLHVCHREWKLLSILKAQKEERLPHIPSGETIHHIFSCVTTFHNFVFFATVYSCGLRLQEALHIQPAAHLSRPGEGTYHRSNRNNPDESGQCARGARPRSEKSRNLTPYLHPYPQTQLCHSSP